ncbi:MAG: Rossmann-like and DUF2520 domain-containing protein [Saprospiraceae bacterium]
MKHEILIRVEARLALADCNNSGMENTAIQIKIVCIGAGRLAHHLMPALQHAGCNIIQVCNRTQWPAVLLAQKLHAVSHITRIEELDKTADVYFLTVSDDAVLEVAAQLESMHDLEGLIVHCSGVLGLNVLPHERKGIFYPLQTFSEHHETEWHHTPIIITANQPEDMEILASLAGKISNSTYQMSDEQKTVIHLAAVFANNFTNHMMTLAEAICAQHEVSFDILKPLIRTTFQKALLLGPSGSQTGPAVRGDEITIEKHLKLLQDYPDLAEVYRIVTKSIVNQR